MSIVSKRGLVNSFFIPVYFQIYNYILSAKEDFKSIQRVINFLKIFFFYRSIKIHRFDDRFSGKRLSTNIITDRTDKRIVITELLNRIYHKSVITLLFLKRLNRLEWKKKKRVLCKNNNRLMKQYETGEIQKLVTKHAINVLIHSYHSNETMRVL